MQPKPLLVSVTSWLEASEWNKTTGDLEEGGKVTVNGDMSGASINMDPFWAKITGILKDNKYTMLDGGGKVHTFPRAVLRFWKPHTYAAGHISDDKKHNPRTMQHFTNNQWKRVEEYIVANFPGDIPHGTIKRLFWHSANASYFKSCGAQNFSTTQITN